MSYKQLQKIATIVLVSIGFCLIVGSVCGVVAIAVKYYPLAIALGVIGMIFASPKLTEIAMEGGTYLEKKIVELIAQSAKPAQPYFNNQLTAAIAEQTLHTLSCEMVGISEVLRPSDIKWSWILKDDLAFLRYQVKRSSKNALSLEDVTYLTTLIQDRAQNLLMESCPTLTDVVWNGNEWCVITVDEVRQYGIYLSVDFIWVGDQRIADYLRQKHFGIRNSEGTDTPTDSDF